LKSIKLILYPFAVLYDLITSIRNSLYERGYKPKATFDIPVIGVGNLAIGGTGKTPMVEYIIRLFNPQFKIATLSRGYGRKTKGFRIAGNADDASTVGDEPFQLHRKFDGKVKVAVGEERALAIPGILQEFPDTQVIILDDAFQHRKVNPSFQVVLTDYNNLFYKDYLLPAGRLRESSRGLSRADAIVVTKCPFDLKEGEMMQIESSIRDYANKPIFFAGIRYGNPVSLENLNPVSESVILVSGIATHAPLEKYISTQYKMIRHFAFADHHSFSKTELATIVKMADAENASVIMTEKDSVKLDPAFLKSLTGGVSFFYLPIKTEFLKNGKEFDEMLLNVVQQT
jgi:tetraacyldisaccharide 4'-kinase